jgi:hypothetical protein
MEKLQLPIRFCTKRSIRARNWCVSLRIVKSENSLLPEPHDAAPINRKSVPLGRSFWRQTRSDHLPDLLSAGFVATLGAGFGVGLGFEDPPPS